MTHIRPNRIVILTLIFTCIFLFVFLLGNNASYRGVRLWSSESDTINLTKRRPGGFLHHLHPKASNVSYCKSNYNFPQELKFARGSRANSPELGSKSPYAVLYNVIEAKITGEVPKITYSTHVTTDFVNYLPELVRYWDGLISIAAFVPDSDVSLLLEQINQYCHCLPGMSRVSLHLVYPAKLPPTRGDLGISTPSHCKVEDMSEVQTYRDFDEKVIYPINVCRNAARTASLTEHVLVSDIQLMPSQDLAQKFWKMMNSYNLVDCSKQVFVLPVFEVEATERIPRTKKKLVQLVREEKAVYFHKLICTHCQKFPGIDAWLETDPGDAIKPWLTVRREIPYNRWEPIYIGTKAEPLYDENLSWEGLQDKMLQMLEMCLLGYRLVILDGGFLVHWPGIKKIKAKDDLWRTYFVAQNAEQYSKGLSNLASKYTPNAQCKLL